MSEMTEEWVILWYQCLYRNRDYEKFCHIADGLDDIDLPWWDEVRYNQLDALYKDFGTLDEAVNLDINSRPWKDWFESRRHLFVSAINEFNVSDDFKPRQHCINLEIPFQSSLAATQKSVNDYLKKYYECHDVIPSPKSKYQLHMVNGRVAHGYEQVRQAVITSREYQSIILSLDHIGTTVRENMISFLRREIDNLGWTLDPKARTDLLENGTMTQERLDVFKVRINKCRRDFLALSRNASRGIFPDLSEFQSDVFDLLGFTYRPE